MKKKRYYYYEDKETYDYIQKLGHWKKSKFVRESTKEKMEREKSYPQVAVDKDK